MPACEIGMSPPSKVSNRMRPLISAILVTLCLVSSVDAIAEAAGAADAGQVVRTEGEAFIQSGGADGMSIAMVRDGRMQFFNFGTIVRGKAQTPDKNTVYEIGSISKTFASLLLAHALVEKKAGAADDMRRYLPGQYPNLEYQGGPVTLANLASTTSALPDNLPDLTEARKKADPKDEAFVVAELLNGYSEKRFFEDLHKVSLVDKPGNMPRHSNVAAALLADIVAKLYGRPYDELLAAYIEKPLGIQSGVAKARMSKMATGYAEGDTVAPAFNAPYLVAAGGLRYSADDMARYIVAQLNADDPAIGLTQQPAWGDVESQAIGFNWILAKTVDSQRRLSHGGGTFGFSSFVDMYPDSRYGIVFLVNRSRRSTQGQLEQMSMRIKDGIFGRPAVTDALELALSRQGYGDVDAVVRQVRGNHPELFLSEPYVNAWGYRLLQGGHAKDAVKMFEYNTQCFPKSWNAYDSLAEAFAVTGDVKGSIANYRRSLEMNSANMHAKGELAKLEKPAAGH